MEPRGYFPTLALPPWFEGPETIRELITELWEQCYPYLYEENCAVPGSLSEAENRVLTALASGEHGHRRLIAMALTFCSAAAVTVDAYLPEDPRPGRVISLLEDWLRDPTTPTASDMASMFSQTATPPQALHESLDVLYQAVRALDISQAIDAVQEILDDCMEGYAIFPGAEGRRDLFNWWLIQVVPASWCLRKPDIVYTMKLQWPPPSR